MDRWHTSYGFRGRDLGACHVCLAGSVLTRFIDISDSDIPLGVSLSYTPVPFDDIVNCLKAIDSFRKGLLEEGCNILGYKLENYADMRETKYYDWCPEEFITEMRYRVKILRNAVKDDKNE